MPWPPGSSTSFNSRIEAADHTPRTFRWIMLQSPRIDEVNIKDRVFVVTGGCGFIGSNVVEALIVRGASEVRIIDLAEPTNVVSSSRVRWFRGDIREHTPLAEIINGADGLFHLATLPTGPCSAEPRTCVEVNVVGTFNVFEAACSAKVRKIV